MKTGERFRNWLTGEKVTIVSIIENIVIYRRDNLQCFENITIKEHSKPLYVFNQIYEPL